MSLDRRRRLMTAVITTAMLAITTGSAAVSYAVVSSRDGKAPQASAAASLAKIPRVKTGTALAQASQVPVLVYHEMNNGCRATAAVCRSHDPYTVSTAQFTAEMDWMYRQGYRTVTLAQYLAWLKDRKTPLPRKPFLITADNGIGNFLEGAQPVLWHYRYTAVAFIVTGFADAAAGHCGPRASGVNVQPGCPRSSTGWDLDWAQLRALSPAVWSFGIEAGADGHYKQDYDRACYAFDACKLPGESGGAYEKRVRSEYSRGTAELAVQLGTRFSAQAWVVPYSDLGYPCRPAGCAYEKHTGPAGWLVSYAATTYRAVFVQDSYRNGERGERFRYEIHALTSAGDFRSAIRHYLAVNAWSWR